MPDENTGNETKPGFPNEKFSQWFKGNKRIVVLAALIFWILILFFTFGSHKEKTSTHSSSSNGMLSSLKTKLSEPKTSRYPWCDTDDIVLPDGKQVWSACNVGASKASLYAQCKSRETCSKDIVGSTFFWGNNQPYEKGMKPSFLTGANVWGWVTNDPELMRGPCETWYHVPSEEDITNAISNSNRLPVAFDPNDPRDKSRDFKYDFPEYIKFPAAGWVEAWAEESPLNYDRDIWYRGRFWLRTKRLQYDHWEPLVGNIQTTVLIKWTDTRYIGVSQFPNGYETLAVRCIKDTAPSDWN